MEQVRYDKSWTDAMTLEELNQLRRRSEGRLARAVGLLDDEVGQEISFWSSWAASDCSSAVRLAACQSGGDGFESFPSLLSLRGLFPLKNKFE